MVVPIVAIPFRGAGTAKMATENRMRGATVDLHANLTVAVARIHAAAPIVIVVDTVLDHDHVRDVRTANRGILDRGLAPTREVIEAVQGVRCTETNAVLLAMEIIRNLTDVSAFSASASIRPNVKFARYSPSMAL